MMGGNEIWQFGPVSSFAYGSGWGVDVLWGVVGGGGVGGGSGADLTLRPRAPSLRNSGTTSPRPSSSQPFSSSVPGKTTPAANSRAHPLQHYTYVGTYYYKRREEIGRRPADERRETKKVRCDDGRSLRCLTFPSRDKLRMFRSTLSFMGRITWSHSLISTIPFPCTVCSMCILEWI